MFLGSLNLKLAPNIITRFERDAKDVFPKEHLGYLFGVQDGNKVEVKELWYPPDVAAHTTPNEVRMNPKWNDRAKRAASRSGLVVLGDIHSHPYTVEEMSGGKHVDRSPSEADWEDFKSGVIMGITVIKQSPAGNLRARTRFWGPLIPVKEIS